MGLVAQGPPVNLLHPGKNLGPGIILQDLTDFPPVDFRPFPGGEDLPGKGVRQVADKAVFVIRVRRVLPQEAGPGDQEDGLGLVAAQHLLDPGQGRGHHPAAAGQGFQDHQGQALEK